MTRKIKIILVSIGITIALLIGAVISTILVIDYVFANAKVNHYASVAACHAIVYYIKTEKKFPHSWDDLEKMPVNQEVGSIMFSWRSPEDREVIKQYIHIDFTLLEKATTRKDVERAMTHRGRTYYAPPSIDELLKAMENLRVKQ